MTAYKQYRWVMREPDQESIENLMQSINVSEPIARALVNRGVKNYDEAKSFFRPSIEHLHSPFLMNGMKEAAERLSKAIDEREKILIYGDYDVDGTTATALLILFLKKFEAEVDFYVNDRKTEGYGIARTGIDYAISQNVKVIVTVDCGVTAIEPIKYCRENQIDVIICDHHEAKAERPDALAILDAKQDDCAYPFKDLSGCGVAFKLACALCDLRGIDREIAYEFLDFVALAVAADIVPVVEENRALMFEGIKRLQLAKRPGLKALAKVSGLDIERLSSSSLVFALSPRINAAGRLDHAREAIKLLIAQDESDAEAAAMHLGDLNKTRREIDADVFKEAEEDAKKLLTQYASSIVLYKPDWHLGVIGIVASRIVERFYLPTIILTENDGILKGSARSVVGFNLFNAISHCETHLIQFGGHEMAAGLSLHIEQLDEFRSAFDNHCAETLDFELRTPAIQIDAELNLEQITPRFYNVLKQFEPCGPGNMHPLFLTRNVTPAYPPKLLKEQHLKFAVRDKDGRIFDVIGFGMAHYFEALKESGRTVSLVYSIDENEWNGKTTFQLRLRDLKVE
ncbi:MAG: single-stranded-DNA-specific exonuclease RecJ [Chloroherpetonaceae bacterium]